MTTNIGREPSLAIQAGIATLQLNRPAQMNRIEPADLDVITRLLDHVRQSDCRVLVLTAQGHVFCAGYDLRALPGAAHMHSEVNPFETLVDQLEALALPTVCGLNGSVYGGATDLALACDFRIGVEGMQLRLPAAVLGLHYYPSGLVRYVSRLGLDTAKRMLLLAHQFDAAELVQVGFLDKLVAPAELDAEVARYARNLASMAPLAVRGMKRSLNEIARGGADFAAMHQRHLTTVLSADLQEGLLAQRAHRAPVFVGR